jgi:hypothetical protein
MIPCENLLREVCYPAEICYERYDTLQKFVKKGLIPCRNSLREIWYNLLREVWYPAEIC